MHTPDVTDKYEKLQSKLNGMEHIFQYMALLSQCTTGEDLNKTIQKLLKVIGQYTEADRVYIFDFFPENNTFCNTFEWCSPGTVPYIDNLQALSDTDMPYWAPAFSRGDSIIIQDIEDVRQLMPSEYQILKPQNIQCLIAFPLLYRSALRGFIGLDNPAMQKTEALLSLLSIVGRTLCNARENIRKDILLEENEISMQNYLRELENERSILSVLCEDYTSVYSVDLRLQQIRPIKIDTNANVASCIDPAQNEPLAYMDLVQQYYNNFVIPASAPDFLDRLDPEYLMTQIRKTGRYVYHYRTIPNPLGREYFEMLASLVEETPEHFRVIMGFHHIDDIVKEEQKQQRKLQEALDNATMNNEIISAISKIYFSIYRIDLENDIYEEISSENELHRLTGHTGKASVKMQELCQTFVSPEYQPQVQQFFDLSTLPRRMRQDESLAIEYLAQDGNWHIARFIVKRRSPNGEITNVLYVTRLISDQKRRERNLIIAAKEAERANQAKSDFLSRMAHDIRTPLNAILGFKDIAQHDAADPAKVSACMDKIETAGQYLKQLVNDLLDVTAIEDGHLQLNPQPVHVSDIYNALTNIFTCMPQKPSLQFFCNQHDILQPVLLADELRLKQIYMNLLSNAVKYTPDGGRVTLDMMQKPCSDPAKVDLVVTIQDTGIGIRPEYLDKMYDKFSREVDTRINAVRGSGLGLAIVKQLVDLMHGTIDAESEVGKGTTFTVTIPLSFVTGPAPDKALDTALEIPKDHPMHLLLADDNTLNYEMLSELLALHNITCDWAKDGAVCVDLFCQKPAGTYDAILMDMQMPVMDGLDATKAIRASSHPQAVSIPVIAITANAFTQDIQKCLAAGMNAHLAKPVDISQLLALLQQYVPKRS